MLRIVEILKRGNYPNATTIAAEIEVSPKTIQRDIVHLRDQMDVSIEYVHSKHGYQLGDIGTELPMFDVGVGDLAALYFASNSLSKHSSAIQEVLQTSFEKIAARFEGSVKFNWQQLDEILSVHDVGVAEADMVLFERVSSALVRSQQITFRYRSTGQRKSMQRTVDPYYVGEIKGGVYVLGYDHTRKDIRQFALQRMIGVEMTGEAFTKLDGFCAKTHFKDGTGAFVAEKDSEVEEAVIICSGWLARVAQERKWHESQTIKVLDDYGEEVELRMRLSEWREVLGLVLSWGRVAKVLGPPSLVNMVKNELEAMQQSYCD